MAQPAYKWSDIEAVYTAVAIHGNVSTAARSFNPPMSNKTVANQYEAALTRFHKPDVRKMHRQAVADDPDKPPESEPTGRQRPTTATVRGV